MRAWPLVFLALGCSSAPAATVTVTPTECVGDAAHYDLAKSRFAFGSTPTASAENGGTRWVGAHGQLLIQANGSVEATLDGGAPEASLPDWSEDPVALTAHVRDYLLLVGTPACELGDAQIMGGSGGRMLSFARRIDGVLVVESLANAQMDRDDQSTYELLYWPALPRDVVDAARKFHDQLQTPSALAAYRAKLPSDAQGDGHVVIHHNQFWDKTPLAVAYGWETPLIVDGRWTANALFDEAGHRIR